YFSCSSLILWLEITWFKKTVEFIKCNWPLVYFPLRLLSAGHSCIMNIQKTVMGVSCSRRMEQQYANYREYCETLMDGECEKNEKILQFKMSIIRILLLRGHGEVMRAELKKDDDVEDLFSKDLPLPNPCK